MVAKTMVGARAKLYVNNQLVGIFDSCSYNVNVRVEAIDILGRYSSAEIAPTGYDPVSVNCSGFRIVGQGPHVLPAFPKLQDLLNLESVTIAVVDRQSGTNILTVIGCVPTSYNGNYNAKATSKIQISYQGLILSDESGAQNENGANDLP